MRGAQEPGLASVDVGHDTPRVQRLHQALIAEPIGGCPITMLPRRLRCQHEAEHGAMAHEVMRDARTLQDLAESSLELLSLRRDTGENRFAFKDLEHSICCGDAHGIATVRST